MTGLFVRFYLGVLAVLLLAWYIHGSVLKRREYAERSRVVVAAHRGGARLVANELDSSPPGRRLEALEKLRQQFAYPVTIVPVTELPKSLRRQVSNNVNVFFSQNKDGEDWVVVTALSTRNEVVRLGPFPDYGLEEIEASIGGWMRLAADRIACAPPGERTKVLADLRSEFAFPIELVDSPGRLPESPRQRILEGEDVVFFSNDGDKWFAATPLQQGNDLAVFGPFPHFTQIKQKAATTTLALVLLPVAVAIALLLHPVARQLRYVERTTKAIAGGNLSARVDERRVNSARSLAQSFNHMAARTESLIRTQRELLQAVSHELRTPLSRMRFAIDLISTAKDDRERQTRLHSLDEATEELDALVGELLSYVRIETAKPALQHEVIALEEALDALVGRFAALFPAIRFDVDIEATETPLVVVADSAAFQRAIGNLLSNAGRFAKGYVRVSARSSKGITTIDVDDDGGGIPAADRDRVFEPFVRLEGRSETNVRGVGLGLALVKRIVSQHGGCAQALSSPLGGCRIRTTWPSQPARHFL